MSSKDTQEKRRRSGRPLMILPILLFGLLGVVFYWGLWHNDDRLPSTLIGRPIPEFALPPIEGRQDGLASANLLDQVSLVNVWASWCVPCRHFREKLEKIRAGYPESELRMLAVSLDRDPGMAAACLARSPLPYPARIGDAELIKARSGMPVPTTILYRRDGSVERELVGDVSEKRLGHYVGRIVRR